MSSHYSQLHYVLLLECKKDRSSKRIRMPRKDRNNILHKKERCLLPLIVFGIGLIFVGVLLLIPGNLYTNLRIKLALCVFIASIMFLLAYVHYRYRDFIREILKRKHLTSREFFENANQSLVDGNMIRIAEALQFCLRDAYGVSAGNFYPYDLLSQFSMLSHSIPLQYEIIVPIAQELEMNLSDDEIDNIGGIINKKASTVYDLYEILYEYLSRRV